MEENNHIETIAPEGDGTKTEEIIPEEQKEQETVEEETTTEAEVPTVMEPRDLIDNIKDTDSLNEFLPLFNLSIAKKQAMRVTKREEVLDMVTDKIKERLEKRPDEISITELNAIDKTMSEQKAKEISIVNSVNEGPAISLNQTNNIIINTTTDRESNSRVIDAVKEILKLVQETQQESPINTDSVEVVDVANEE